MSCKCVVKLIDVVLFLFFLLLAIVCPLFDAQNAVGTEYYPKQLVDLNAWYASEYGDYLVTEMPHFFRALLWLELLLQWPLCLVNLYALVYRKSWFNTTCLLFGACTFTSMAAVMGELLGSGRGTNTLMMIYSPFMAMSVVAVLRGLIPCAAASNGAVAQPAKKAAPPLQRKKKA